MKQADFNNSNLGEMTMDLLLKRLAEESPHLSSPQYGNGELEIIYSFNNVPRVIDSFSVINESNGKRKVSFPARKYDKTLLEKNIQTLYHIVQTYLSTRVIPQGKITVQFNNGIVSDCKLSNDGSYRDLVRTGKSKIDLDEILFGEEENEE